MFWPCETRTSTCRSFATISSGLYRFLAIAVLLDVKDIPQVGPLQWGWVTGDMTFLVTELGKPFTGVGFSNWFRRRCDMANLHHCSAHGLRKAAARRLAEAGCTPHEIAAITGHASLREVERYTRAV